MCWQSWTWDRLWKSFLKQRWSCKCQVGVAACLRFQTQKEDTGDTGYKPANKTSNISELWVWLRTPASVTRLEHSGWRLPTILDLPTHAQISVTHTQHTNMQHAYPIAYTHEEKKKKKLEGAFTTHNKKEFTLKWRSSMENSGTHGCTRYRE